MAISYCFYKKFTFVLQFLISIFGYNIRFLLHYFSSSLSQFPLPLKKFLMNSLENKDDLKKAFRIVYEQEGSTEPKAVPTNVSSAMLLCKTSQCDTNRVNEISEDLQSEQKS